MWSRPGKCGRDVFGPVPEIRRLDDIRSSLEDPQSKGPEEVYAIVMDVGLAADREEIVGRNLLFGKKLPQRSGIPRRTK